jgi:hypothetical protein
MSSAPDINISEPAADNNLIENVSDDQINNDPVTSGDYIQESYNLSDIYTYS